jgi:hypothetical protein
MVITASSHLWMMAVPIVPLFMKDMSTRCLGCGAEEEGFAYSFEEQETLEKEGLDTYPRPLWRWTGLVVCLVLCVWFGVQAVMNRAVLDPELVRKPAVNDLYIVSYEDFFPESSLPFSYRVLKLVAFNDEEMSFKESIDDFSSVFEAEAEVDEHAVGMFFKDKPFPAPRSKVLEHLEGGAIKMVTRFSNPEILSAP